MIQLKAAHLKKKKGHRGGAKPNRTQHPMKTTAPKEIKIGRYIGFRLKDADREALREIVRQNGSNNVSEAIRRTIREAHQNSGK